MPFRPEMRPDLLADVPWRHRLRREEEDANYLRSFGTMLTASKASLERDANTWAGLRQVFDKKDFRPYEPGDKVDFVVCARVDLDHPIYFPDNRFTDCADCGCRLQYRPVVPPGDKVCICCAARRQREAGE